MGVQYHPWSKVDIRRLYPHSIQWVRPQGWGTWELIRDRCILVHPFPSDWDYLRPTSFIERIFLNLHSWCRCLMFQAGRSALGWPLRGVRLWNSPGRILVKNHLHSLYPHKGVVLSRTNPHDTCWQYPLSQLGWEHFTGFDDPFSPTCPETRKTSFPRIKIIVYLN